ncbi:hypothetical protein HispidOSU_022685, partial [Sigmodon hispidus]
NTRCALVMLAELLSFLQKADHKGHIPHKLGKYPLSESINPENVCKSDAAALQSCLAMLTSAIASVAEDLSTVLPN